MKSIFQSTKETSRKGIWGIAIACLIPALVWLILFQFFSKPPVLTQFYRDLCFNWNLAKVEPLAEKIGARFSRPRHPSDPNERYHIGIWFQDRSNMDAKVDGLVELVTRMKSLGLTDELGIDVSRSGLSDTGLMKLAGSPIVSLRLLQTLVTKEGIAKFRKASKIHALTDFDHQEAKIQLPDR